MPSVATYIAPPAGSASPVLHRMSIGIGVESEFGHWYTACGRIQPGWTTMHLEKGERECKQCVKRQSKRAARKVHKEQR